MKTRFENSSGFSFDDVRVHYYSDNPDQLQALAYTQGNQVHIAQGQEKHLEHELGHVIQQKRGIVKPTTTVGGIATNDDVLLEREADLFANYNGFPVQMKPTPCSGSGIVQMMNIGKEQRKPASDKIVPSPTTSPPITGILPPLKNKSASLISSATLVAGSAETVGLELEIHEAIIIEGKIPSKTVLARSSAEKMGIPTIQIVVDGITMIPYCEIVSMPLHCEDAKDFLSCAEIFRACVKNGKLSVIIAKYNDKVKKINHGVFQLTVQGKYGDVYIYRSRSNPPAFRHTNVSVPYEQIGVPDKGDFVRTLFTAKEQTVFDLSRKSAQSLVEECVDAQTCVNLVSLFTQIFFQSIVLGASGISKKNKTSKLKFSTLFKTSSLDAIFYILSDDEVTILNNMMKNKKLLSIAKNKIKGFHCTDKEKYQFSLFEESCNLIKNYTEAFTGKSADVTGIYHSFADLSSGFTHDTPRPDNVIKPVRDNKDKSYVILEVRSSTHPMNDAECGLSNPFGTPKKDTPQKATPQKATPQKATPQKDTPQKATPQKSYAAKRYTAKATPQKATPQKSYAAKRYTAKTYIASDRPVENDTATEPELGF